MKLILNINDTQVPSYLKLVVKIKNVILEVFYFLFLKYLYYFRIKIPHDT